MHEIHLPVFEGPLELLLNLIERNDLDITAVSLVAVTDQYLAAVRAAEEDSLPALADFVAIGAKLIYLKSRALLPGAEDEDSEGLEEDETGQDLVDLLTEYRRFRPVTATLADRQDAGLRAGPRPVASALPDTAALGDVTLEALRTIMLEALARKPATPPADLTPDPTVPLSLRVADLRSRLATGEHLSFRRLVESARTRGDVVVTFLAVLELLKAGECDAFQSGNWEDIEIVALTPAGG